MSIYNTNEVNIAELNSPSVGFNSNNLVQTIGTITGNVTIIQSGLSGAGGVKVFVSGLGESNIIWGPLIATLNSTYGFAATQILTLSPPGFGGVPWPVNATLWPAGYQSTREDLAIWLQSQLQIYIDQNIPIDIVGHDFGAVAAVSLAIYRPNTFRTIVVDVQGLDQVLPSVPFGSNCFALGPFQAGFNITAAAQSPPDLATARANLKALLEAQIPGVGPLFIPLFIQGGLTQAMATQIYVDTVFGNESLISNTAVALVNDNVSLGPEASQTALLGDNDTKNILIFAPDGDVNPCGLINNNETLPPVFAEYAAFQAYVTDSSGVVKDLMVDLSGNPAFSNVAGDGYYFYNGSTNNITGYNTRNLGTINSMNNADVINSYAGASADCVILTAAPHEWMVNNPTLSAMLITNHWKRFA